MHRNEATLIWGDLFPVSAWKRSPLKRSSYTTTLNSSTARSASQPYRTEKLCRPKRRQQVHAAHPRTGHGNLLLPVTASSVLFLCNALEGLAILLDVHKTSGFGIPFCPQSRSGILSLSAIADGSFSVPVPCILSHMNSLLFYSKDIMKDVKHVGAQVNRT